MLLCSQVASKRGSIGYGPLYAPNITPDKAQGIRAWTDDEFYRALHEGVGRHGEYLYPAFPYQWFTKVTRDNVLAIRAFLNTGRPSSVASKPNRLMFPFSIRAGLGPWNDLYFHPGEFQPDAAKSDTWSGAYLVEGLGHCGDCHTPKGIAMQPLRAKAFSGGEIDDWYAPNITFDPAWGIGSWSEDAFSLVVSVAWQLWRLVAIRDQPKRSLISEPRVKTRRSASVCRRPNTINFDAGANALNERDKAPPLIRRSKDDPAPTEITRDLDHFKPDPSR